MAIKVLIVIHRTLREGDPTFRDELLNYSHRGHILRISNFKDDTSPLGRMIIMNFWYVNETLLKIHFLDHLHGVEAWDCSAWIRTYALFLEERLECYRVLKYDIEAERLPKGSGASSKVCTGASHHLEPTKIKELKLICLYHKIHCSERGFQCFSNV